MRQLRNIQAFMLMLAMMMVIAVSAVPHHHHDHNVQLCTAADYCHDSDEEDEAEDEEHCVAHEKYLPGADDQNRGQAGICLQQLCDGLPFESVITDPTLTLQTTIIPSTAVPLPDRPLVRAQGLRAPPAFHFS